MKQRQHLLTILIAALVAAVMVFFFAPQTASNTNTAKESVYERVMRTGTIRCGYIVYHPAMIKDEKTGELSGIFYDFVNEVGQKLSLNVEWVEEAGWGSFVEDLKGDRYDMMCSTAWRNSARARELDPVQPLYYSGVYVVVRADDHRFDEDITILNDPAYRLVTIDGSSSSLVKRSDFPKAEELSLSELSAAVDLVLPVITGKADATFLEAYAAHQFLESHPGAIRTIGTPVRFYGNSMWVKKGQEDFLSMINVAIEETLGTKSLQNIFDHYYIKESAYALPARPYEVTP